MIGYAEPKVPPKKKRGRAKTAFPNVELTVVYHTAAFLAKMFERPFWLFEQWRGRLLDRIDNERSDQ
jgi:hypothetical protein